MRLITPDKLYKKLSCTYNSFLVYIIINKLLFKIISNNCISNKYNLDYKA